MKKVLILGILLMMAVFFVFPQEGRSLYDSGLELYRSRDNQEALRLFEKFRQENPEDVKQDDALWYIGRIYNRLDQTDRAEQAFREVLSIAGTNRYSEAAYDLARILFDRRSYGEVDGLLSDLAEKPDPDSYELRSLSLLGKSLYNLGLAEKGEYRDREAEDHFRRAAAVFLHQLDYQPEEADRADTAYLLGRSYRHLALLELSREDTAEYTRLALGALRDSGLPEAAALADDLASAAKGNLQFRLTGLGGAVNLLSGPGFDATADLNVFLPLGYRKELKAGLRYSHDDFSFKTFNFDPAETGDERLIQSTDKISADISLNTGSYRGFLNTLRLDGDYRFAEDAGDNYYDLKLSEDFQYRMNSQWRAGADTEFSWKVFPDYLEGGHKIDSLEMDLYPNARWYFSDTADLSFGYRFNLKQYLEAKYDTANPLVASTEDRRYLSSSLDLELKADLGSLVKTRLSYEFLILESVNYDVWITDTAATDKFMTDYNDYLQHTVKASADFQWSERLRTGLGGMLEIRNFTNYVARDASGVFLPGDEKRKDLTFGVDGEFGWIFWTGRRGSTAELLLQLSWDRSVSNMEYETSFDTNSSVLKGLAGVEVRLP